jgi:hypothetical protein
MSTVTCLLRAPQWCTVLEYLAPDCPFKLRAAQARTQTGALEQLPTLRRTLELKLDTEAATGDTPPVLSALMHYDIELALRQLAQRLCADGYDDGVIVATDPADVLFVVSEIRKYCAEIPLATLGGDLLFTHPDEDLALSGMLVASSYPLMFESRALSSRGQQHAFPSETAQGFYNAALAHLGELRYPLNPKMRPSLHGYHGPLDNWSEEKWAPQLWLTMIANGRFWPIASEPAKGSSCYRFREWSGRPSGSTGMIADKANDRQIDWPQIRRHMQQLLTTRLTNALAVLFLVAAFIHLVVRACEFVRLRRWQLIRSSAPTTTSVETWQPARECYLTAPFGFSGIRDPTPPKESAYSYP